MVNNEDAGLDRPLGLVEMVYESMLDPGALQQVVQGLCTELDADGAHLLAIPALNRSGFWVGHRIDPAMVDSYEQYYTRVDPWREALPALAPGQAAVFRGDDLVPPAALLASEFYNDFLLPQCQRYIHGVLVRPEAPGAPSYALSVFRGAGREPFDERADAILAGLGRHLLRVERLGVAAMLAGSDARGDAVFFLGAGGRLIQCNKAAQAMIGDGVVVDGARTVSFASQSLNLWLHGLVSSRERMACDRTRHCTTAHDPVMGTLEFELAPLRVAAPTPSLRAARLMLRVRHAAGDMSGNVFARAAWSRYSLTASEVDILQKLAAGATVVEIADARQCSPETVRSHLKSAKRKVSVSRQVDLVRLVLDLGKESGGRASG